MNFDKYKNAFIESFQLEETTNIESLEYNTIDAWDSIGHMSLIATLETEFDIMMDMDDIVDFSSFQKGIEIMSKYGVEF